MTTFVMIGNYTGGSIGCISAQRTDEAKSILASCGGKLVTGYATLGESDVVLICELPNTEAAIKASIALTKALGISFRTAPAVPVDVFDKLVGE
ncbi:MAG: GYD domain-containing protein [Chthonomonadales bacterium]|nr:GYD domain-containing protein [Chthonomonadales bacterium]